MDEASMWMQNASTLYRRGRWHEAEECYRRVLAVLRGQLLRGGMTPSARHELMQFMSDVAKRVQQLQQQQQQGKTPSPSQPPLPTTTTTPSPRPRVDDNNKQQQQQQQQQQPSASHSSPSPPPPSSPSPPPLPLRRASPAPPISERVPDYILQALSIATRLSEQQHDYKRAVDVVQYACTLARCEQQRQQQQQQQGTSAAPAAARVGDITHSLRLVEEALAQCRRRYYQAFPPRFLQDNDPLPSEVELLRRSSVTDTIVLPIWDDVHGGYAAENVYMPDDDRPWEDSVTPRLNPLQRRAGATLLHLADVGRPLSAYAVLRDSAPLKIRQNCVADCAMVCSLINCASFQARFPRLSIIRHAIFPQDAQGQPVVHARGKYCVKLLINGITRMVAIDDRLPVQPATRRWLCTCSSDATELWVSLIEKAFVKVCGGSYDFPGSTSGCDLYKLSGWLPETLNTTLPSFDADGVWQRLQRSFAAGAVLVTLGIVDDLPLAEVAALKLYGRHGYALLDMRVVAGRRVLLLRNPWPQHTWTGTFGLPSSLVAAHRRQHKRDGSPTTTSTSLVDDDGNTDGDDDDADDDGHAAGDTNTNNNNNTGKRPGGDGRGHATHAVDALTARVHAAFGYTIDMAALGAFCIPYEDVLRFFGRLYLSWNPYMLYPDAATGAPRRPTRLACHGVHRYTTAMGLQPQLHIGVVAAPRTTRMYLVLSRHIVKVAEFDHVDGGSSDTAADDAAAAAAAKATTATPPAPAATTTRNESRLMLGLRVFDVTAYPSVAQRLTAQQQQQQQQQQRPTPLLCGFAQCRCRRLAGVWDLPEPFEQINAYVHHDVGVHTVSFDCPAGTRDLVVVVARAGAAVRQDVSFTVTLHTELPQLRLPHEAGRGGSSNNNNSSSSSSSEEQLQQQVLLPVGGSGGRKRTASASPQHVGVYMHAIPATTLRYTSVHEGAWVAGRSCGGRVYSAGFARNPHYTLTLRAAAAFAVRLAVTSEGKKGCVHILHEHAASASLLHGGGGGVSTTAAEEQQRMARYDLVLQPTGYVGDGVTLDSAQPWVVVRDRHKMLHSNATATTAQQWWSQRTRQHSVRVQVCRADGSSSSSSSNASSSSSSSFVMYIDDLAAEATVLLLGAVARGHAVSLSRSALHIGGDCSSSSATAAASSSAAVSGAKRVDAVRTTVAALQQQARTASALDTTTSAAATTDVACCTVCVHTVAAQRVAHDGDDVCVSSTSRALAAELRTLAGSVCTGVVRVTDQTRQLEHMQRRIRSSSSSSEAMAADEAAYLSELCKDLLAYVTRDAARVREAVTTAALTAAPPLLQLPAGEYAVVPSLVNAEEAATFVLTVETTEPHTVTLTKL